MVQAPPSAQNLLAWGDNLTDSQSDGGTYWYIDRKHGVTGLRL